MSGSISCPAPAKMARAADGPQEWRREVLRWYPKLHDRAYFVPPVYMMRINYDRETVAGQDIAVPKPPVKTSTTGKKEVDEGEQLEDQAQQRILHCLQKLSEKQKDVMFVLSQLQFSSYLENAENTLPRPADLKPQNQDRGDFDVLIIHRHYGLLAAEVKSVGNRKPEQQAEEDGNLVRRLKTITKQLNKSRNVLIHLTKGMTDEPNKLRVTTTFMLPNVTTAQLKRVLENNSSVRESLCTSLGIQSTENVLDLCLTSKRVSDRRHFWEVTDDVIQGLEQWWRAVLTRRGPDPNMSQDVYEELVARFAGPATTVEVFHPSKQNKKKKNVVCVRTEGEGVSDTGDRHTALVLHEQQIGILHSNKKRVYLTGPPGTGKTTLLTLQARRWLREGHEVQIVSMYENSMAATEFIAESLKSENKNNKVHVHSIHEKADEVGAEEDAVVTELLNHVDKDGQLFVIVDEVNGDHFVRFYGKLCDKVEDDKLHLWAARIYHSFIPSNIEEVPLNISVRSPGRISREVQGSDFFGAYDTVRPYTDEFSQLSQTDGPTIRELRHEGPGHPNDVTPSACEECAREVAAVLRELHVGDSVATASAEDGPCCLQYRDVFILSFSLALDGFNNGLRKYRIPFKHFRAEDLHREDKQVLTEVVTMTGNDEVIVAEPRIVYGLERKVVVWLESEAGHRASEQFARLHAFSRSSSQLILVRSPWSQQPPSTNAPDDQPNDRRAVEVLEALLDELKDKHRTEALRMDNTEASATVQLIIRYCDEQRRVFNVSIERGQVTFVENHKTQPDGVVIMPSEDLLTLVRNPFMGVIHATQHNQLKIKDTTRLLTCQPLLQHLTSLLDDKLRQSQEASGGE